MELRALNPSRPYESPYASNDQAFPSGWWDGLSPALANGIQALTFTVDSIEVARASIYDPAYIAAEHENFDRSLPTIEIYRFETNVSMRCQGYGRDSVELIRHLWPTSQVVARSFDEATDRFWSKLGFVERPRLDAELGHYPFFAAPPLM